MKKIGRAFGSRRLLAVAALFVIALMALIAVPIVASAGEPENDAPNRPPLNVAECQERVDSERQRMDAFMDELVTDAVINAEQAAEIEARLDARHADACVARILYERGNAIEAASEITGTEMREVLGAIVSGQSLSQFAAEHGVDDATLIDAIMAGPEEKAAGLVASGEISQEDADRVLSRIEERVTAMIQKTDVTPRRFRGA